MVVFEEEVSHFVSLSLAAVDDCRVCMHFRQTLGKACRLQCIEDSRRDDPLRRDWKQEHGRSWSKQ